MKLTKGPKKIIKMFWRVVFNCLEELVILISNSEILILSGGDLQMSIAKDDRIHE